MSSIDMRTSPSSPVVGSTKVWRRDGSQILFVRGRGHFVEDERAKLYFDFSCGVGGVSIGHSDDQFNQRMVEAISNGLSFPGYGEVHAKLAARLLEGTKGKSVVSYFKTGSETVSGALRLAIAETGRSGVIRCGYTGQHDWQIAASPAWHEPLDSPLRNVTRPVPGCRGVSGNEIVADWVDLDPSSLEDLIDRFPGCFGALVLDAFQFEWTSTQAILAGVDICQRAGMIVILDETKTAGRRGPRGSWEHELGDRAQYSALGKAIGNGAPISVLIGPSDRENLYRSSRIGGTHSKETFGAHAALRVAEIMRERDGYNSLAEIGHAVIGTLNAAIEDGGASDYVATVPMLGGRLFDFKFSTETIASPTKRKELVMCLLDEGIIALEGHCSFISLAHGAIDHGMLHERARVGFQKWRATSL